MTLPFNSFRSVALIALIGGLSSCPKRDNSESKNSSAATPVAPDTGPREEVSPATVTEPAPPDVAGKLDPSTALKLIAKNQDLVAKCEVGFDTRMNVRETLIDLKNQRQVSCAELLEKRKIARIGPCVTVWGCPRGCCHKTLQMIKATASPPQMVRFKCGARVPKIVSIMTEGARATVLFELTEKPDVGLVTLAYDACLMSDHPKPRVIEGRLRAFRDDAGIWRTE